MSQPMQVAPKQPSSVRGEQLAASYHLGMLQQEYGVHLSFGKLFGGLIYTILGTGLFVLFYVLPTTDTASILWIVDAIAAFLLLFGLYNLFYPLIYNSWQVYVCSEGFIFSRGGKIDIFRWDQVDAMWQYSVKHYVNGIYTGTTHKYTILGLDKKRVVLNDRLSQVEKLAGVISERVTRVLYPRVLAAFRAGGVVSFGVLNVSMQGVSRGSEHVPWNQIKAIDVKNGVVILKQEGKWLNKFSVRVADIPNFPTFLALINAVRSGSI